VAARNDATGLTRTAVTNTTGDYTLTQLPPGDYTVSVELAGFKKAVRSAVPVNVGSRVTLGFDLAVGELSEAVEVTAETPLIETTKSDLSGVVTPKEIQNLPMLEPHVRGALHHHAGGAPGR
jgi:hypothetical protein